jgi:DNA polymerase I-like protein with 3'-5' exonuclease and polymerase domains
LASALNTSREQAQWFINYWFRLHPKILEFHERLQDSLNRTRCVHNAFGYRRFYFDRVSEILPEAIAWIGQSTTACVTNRALVAIRRAMQDPNCPLHKWGLELLFQVHDEIILQYSAAYRNEVLAFIKPLVHIQVPFADPLVIPWGLKVSRASWGQCEKIDWPVN